jgi:hypothetical protein
MSEYLLGAMILSSMCKDMLLKRLLVQEQESTSTVLAVLFSSWFWRSQNKIRKGCYCGREKNRNYDHLFSGWNAGSRRQDRPGQRPLVLAKEKFVFLSFGVIYIV